MVDKFGHAVGLRFRKAPPDVSIGRTDAKWKAENHDEWVALDAQVAIAIWGEGARIYDMQHKRKDGTTHHRVMYRARGTSNSLGRIVLGYDGPGEVDHINGNGLDCRKKNLRIVTLSENRRNRRGWGKYHKNVTCKNGRFYATVGPFDTEQDAIVALNRYRSAVDIVGNGFELKTEED